MIGTHAAVILADAAIKGLLSPAEIEEAYTAARVAATCDRSHAGREGWQVYEKLGYLPSDKYSAAVSKTLAYAYDDFAIGVLASAAGNRIDAAKWSASAHRGYHAVWDADRLYMCPRASTGTFHCDMNPWYHGWMVADDGFCEGDAAEWRWFVPHDLPGLVRLFRSAADYTAELESFFNRTYRDANTALPNPAYWAGNEPGILEPWQFSAAGRADLTQLHTRKIMRFAYSVEPDGMPGNDDFGALSSWYVWAAVGLYPLPGSKQYILGSPSFAEINITVGVTGSDVLSVVAHGASDAAIYVAKAQINGRSIDLAKAPYIEHAEIVSGGLLECWMEHDRPSLYARR